jgi:hypothetical protein
MENYEEYLKEEINKATNEFEEAKKNAIKEIENMDWVTATDYGAGYATKIEDITKAAAKMRYLGEALRAYKHFNK